MLCTATDVGIYGLLASQSCYHSMLAPCWFTLWTSSRFLYPYILLISLEIFLFSCIKQENSCTDFALLAQTLHSGVIFITQIEKMAIQEFSTSNITVLPPSRFSTSQDIDNISVRKKYILFIIINVILSRLAILV